jgi:tRNA modification GTPase
MSATIAAVSSPPGPGLRAVIRVSGPEAARLVRETARLTTPFDPGRRAAHRGRFLDGRGEQPLLLLWMPGPHSYTREDVAELHLPGAPPLVEAALRRLLELGAQPAAPGEFTRRAFEHGRLDLTRAEGVLAVIEASNQAEARAASALLLGGLAERAEALRDGLEELRALAEASLDFDEADTGHVSTEELLRLGGEVSGRLREALTWEERREPLPGVPRVVLAGAPNAGKSSLFNALVGEGRALVSDLAGTTRDGVAALWRLCGEGGDAAGEGSPEVRLLDAPGLEDGALSEADRGAQEIARDVRAGADLLLHVVDATRPELARAFQSKPSRPEPGRPVLRVWSKLDLVSAPPREAAGEVAVSALTGAGLEHLEEQVRGVLGLSRATSEPAPESGGVGRELSVRHRHALEASLRELEQALALLRAGAPLDLVAEALRWATDALDGITGRSTPEDLLDRIFARFCLGK